MLLGKGRSMELWVGWVTSQSLLWCMCECYKRVCNFICDASLLCLKFYCMDSKPCPSDTIFNLVIHCHNSWDWGFLRRCDRVLSNSNAKVRYFPTDELAAQWSLGKIWESGRQWMNWSWYGNAVLPVSFVLQQLSVGQCSHTRDVQLICAQYGCIMRNVCSSNVCVPARGTPTRQNGMIRIASRTISSHSCFNAFGRQIMHAAAVGTYFWFPQWLQ